MFQNLEYELKENEKTAPHSSFRPLLPHTIILRFLAKMYKERCTPGTTGSPKGFRTLPLPEYTSRVSKSDDDA